MRLSRCGLIDAYKRINLFHELLGYEKSRIIGWSAAHAILVAGQNLKDHGEESPEWLTLGKNFLEIAF